MISSWTSHGIWGDPNTPAAAEVFVPLVGAWTSLVIDVSEGVQRLGRVTHGYLYWYDKLPKGTSLLCDVRVNDTGDWQRDLVRGTPILRAHEWNDVPNPCVRIRARLFTIAGDVTPLADIHLVKLAVVLSRRGSMAWRAEHGIRLDWRYDS